MLSVNIDGLYQDVDPQAIKQNDFHFTEIFKCIFLNENVWFLTKICKVCS